MNDLNSIFMAGRIKGKAILSEDKKVLSFTLVNNDNSFDEEKKVYKTDANDFSVVLNGVQAEKLSRVLSTGTRIGVNGKLTKEGITAYTIQFLEAKQGA